MLKPKEYLSHIQDAFDRARHKTHDLAGSPLADAEELMAQLAMRGLLIVEIPVGVSADFQGVPRAVIDQ